MTACLATLRLLGISADSLALCVTRSLSRALPERSPCGWIATAQCTFHLEQPRSRAWHLRAQLPYLGPLEPAPESCRLVR